MKKVEISQKEKGAVPVGHAPITNSSNEKRSFVLLRSVRQRLNEPGLHDEQTPCAEILLADEHLEPVLARSLLACEDGGVVRAPVGEFLGAGEHRADGTSFTAGFPKLVACARRRLVLLPFLMELPDRFVRMRERSLTIAHRALAEDTEPPGAGFDQDEAVDGVVAEAALVPPVHFVGGRDVAVLVALPPLALLPGVGEIHEPVLIHERPHFVLCDAVAPAPASVAVVIVELVGDLFGRGVVAASVTEVAGERAGVGIDVPFPDLVERRRKIERHSLECSVSHRTPPFVWVWVDFQEENGTMPLSRTMHYCYPKYSITGTYCQANQHFCCFYGLNPMNFMIKNFSVPQIKNMVRADVFLRVLLRFLSVRLRRISDFSRGAFIAAAGGENGSHYFNNTGHFSKKQARGSRLASLGGHFVLDFGGKNELAVSFGGRKNF